MLQTFLVVIPAAVVMLVCCCLSAIFSSSETSFFSLTRDELKLFQLGTRRQQLVARLMKHPDRILTAVLFWNLVINLAYFATSVVMVRLLLNSGQTLAAGIASIAGLLFIILFGEVLPKCLAVMYRQPISVLTSPILSVSVRLVRHAIPFFDVVCTSLRKGFWPNLTYEPLLDIEDLEQAINVSSHSKDLARIEKQVLQNILEMMDVSVVEVMRPRGTYFTASAPINRVDLHGLLPPDGYVLIVEPGSDDITGAISLNSYTNIPEKHLEYTAEKIIHVPWCAKLSFVLSELRTRLRSVASIVNEYGETIGIVTYEDIIDTIIEIDASRTRRVLQRDPVVHLANGDFSVEGMTTLRYLSRQMNIDYDPPEGGLTTVAGLLHEELEKIPVEGDSCQWQGYKIEVTQSNGRGRIKVKLSKPNLDAIPVSDSASSTIRPQDPSS